MTTYNTYQEAKIANPDKEIIRFDKQDEFKAVGNDELSAYLTTWTKCNPADHCITVEKFLADGYKFEIGDICLDDEGQVINIDVEGHTWNKPDKFDVDRYVLQAAALEEKTTPTKFVKVEESIFDLKGEFERGELFTKKAWGEYVLIKEDAHLASLYEMQSHENSKIGIYRQVEIDWRDEVDNYLYVLNNPYFTIRNNPDKFIAMCHEIASLTEKPTN